MKSIALFIFIFCFAGISKAEDIFRIEIGKADRHYSQDDLQRRIWELERAVWQLQQKVFQLEASKSPQAEAWLCTVKAMGETYTGTGGSKAVASSKALENCRNGRNGDTFFCKDPHCEQ